MPRVDVRVHSPTGWLWLVALTTIIGAGEGFQEVQKPGIAQFFGRPFTDDEVWPVLVLLAAAAVASVLGLVAMYVWPGRLIIDAGQMRRERRRRGIRHVIEAPLASWRVRVLFYSDRDRQSGAFKRLELQGPGLHEVLLYGDIERPDVLLKALRSAQTELGDLTLQVEQASASEPGS